MRKWAGFRFLITAGLGFFLSPNAWAATPDAKTFRYQGLFTWIQAARFQKLQSDHAFNPGNANLNLPEFTLQSELRPDVRVSHPVIEFVLRPRIRLTQQWPSKRPDGGRAPARGFSRNHIQEAFLQWSVAPHLSFVYGLQSFQWGPAEGLSPSNRLFHESVLDRHNLYEAEGKHLARLNFSLGEALSLVFMTEYQEAKSASLPFQAEAVVSSTSLVKAEYSWAGGANYAGLVAGGREKGRPWLGEYFNIELGRDRGLFAYADLAHQKGSQAYYPQAADAATGLVSFAASAHDDPKVYTLAALGLRYDLDDGTVVRLEYLHNDAGYSPSQRRLAQQKPRVPLPAAVVSQQALRALAPGLELPGRRYLFWSLLRPDLFQVKDLNLAARLLYALSDRSFNSYASLDYATGEAGSLYAAGSYQHGSASAELAGLTTHSFMIGYRHVW